jgi:hypothetical protein
VHDHLEKGDGGDTDICEVLRICAPWPSIAEGFLFIRGIGVEGVAGRVDEFYGVLELYELLAGMS